MSKTERLINNFKYFYNSLVSIMSDDLDMFAMDEDEDWEEEPEDVDEEPEEW